MDKLSSAQQKVLGLQEDTLVLAGAGAGKTATLLQALALDLETMPPGEIAVCTFTRSAADSLRARLEETLFEKGMDVNLDPIWIGTIDAIAARVIRTFSLQSGADPGVSAGAEYQLRALAREALARCQVDHKALSGWMRTDSLEFLQILQALPEKIWVAEPPELNSEELLGLLAELLEEASTTKQEEALAKDIQKISAGEIPGTTKWHIRKQSLQDLLGRAVEARDRYQTALLDQKTYPLREALLLLREEWQEHFQRLCQEKGTYPFPVLMQMAQDLRVDPFLQKVYLDEAQDTTTEQYHFLRSLLRGPLVSVGDPNQAIFGFRGADLQNFLQETAGQPEIRLLDNYRSAPEILETVEELCRPLLGESLLQMISGGDAASVQGEVASYLADDEREALVILLTEELQNSDPEDISVLFRSNADLESFYRRARAAGLPVVALRSGGLLLQEECRDLLALARLLIDSEDEESLLRVLSSPLGGKNIEELLDLAGNLQAADLDLDSFRRLLAERPLSEVLWLVLEERHFDAALFLLDPGGARWSNVEQFLRLLQRCEQEGWGMEYDLLLQDFEQRLREERVQTDVEGSVVFQTIHTAKGTEYQTVVLPRMGRQIPTSSRRKFFIGQDNQLGIALPGGLRDSVAAAGEVEAVRAAVAEEKRLLYVALTRARQKLLLLGSTKPLRGLVSRLPNIKELPRLQKAQAAPPSQEDDPQEQAPRELPAARPERLSWSTLESWSLCSLRRQLEGEWGLVGEEGEGGQGARQRGIRIHNALAGQKVDLLPEEEELVRRARPEWERGSCPQTEVPFLLPLGSYILRGRIDLILETPEGFLVLDWKTGGEDFDYSLQRKLYALAVGGPVRSETVYLRSGKRETDFWSKEDHWALEQEVLQEIDHILQRPAEPAALQPEPFCAGCPGRQVLCPVSKALLEEDPQKLLSESNEEATAKEVE